MVVIGALIILNEQNILPRGLSTWALIGTIMIILGAIKFVWPNCEHCKVDVKPTAKAK